ncbi:MULTISPECIES: hypothetical protein [unclassified Moorena]|uniref:hypothetical protein n=1 Tax=unclassified Moorena TaxID=2683338 RepID=UPI001400CD5E|nr:MULTISPECIES: hypothetical protein [unclassified Moorena]NEO16334.1 hypothetical protein [Moorena sp. SIO3E8]NEQ02871.1 hypothetical protein [Moorena sp. SIO3F7]
MKRISIAQGIGNRESGIGKEREVWEVWEVWGDGEMGRWGDGEMGRWGDGEIFIKSNYPDMI